MKDIHPATSRWERFATGFGHFVSHFLDGFSRNGNYQDEDEISSRMFDEAIDKIRKKEYEKDFEGLKLSNKKLRCYLKALLMTIKGKVNLHDPVIQKEIKAHWKAVSAHETPSVIEVSLPEIQREERFRFLSRPKEKSRFDSL
jgi:hypothetical protein